MASLPPPPGDADTGSGSDAAPDDGAGGRRPVRSYVLRAGRTTGGQARALSDLGPRFLVPFCDQPPDWDALFGRVAPRVLEIGFGMGEATAAIAAARADTDFIACEVHEPGVGALLKRIGERSLANLRLVRHDAVPVLRQMIAPASLAAVHLFFPDPWHKTRHHKRRLVQAPFARLVAERLAPCGRFHAATDWEAYARQMLEVLGAEPMLRNTAPGYAPKPDYRPLTKFEQRGHRLGHGVWDLVFERAPVPPRGSGGPPIGSPVDPSAGLSAASSASLSADLSADVPAGPPLSPPR